MIGGHVLIPNIVCHRVIPFYYRREFSVAVLLQRGDRDIILVGCEILAKSKNLVAD